MEEAIRNNDAIFRRFQINKFSRRHMVPAVTMQVDADATQILKLKDRLNNEAANGPHITVTHIVMKAAADALACYPVLYSYFNGRDIVKNSELILNIPVDVESHVEYIVVQRPESKTIAEISAECREELERISMGNGTFIKFLLNLDHMSAFRKLFYFLRPNGTIRFLRVHYGNFPISNFGSFHVNSGSLALSQPMVSGLCMGAITKKDDRQCIPLTLTFDHRAVDGAYAGKFLNSLRTVLEQPDSVLEGW